MTALPAGADPSFRFPKHDGTAGRRGFLRRVTHPDGHGAVGERDLGWRTVAHRLEEEPVLVVGRAVVVPCVQEDRVHRHLPRDRAARRPRASDDFRHREAAGAGLAVGGRGRDERLYLPLGTHRRDFLLVGAALCEHAEFEHCACAVGKVDDDVAVVPDVGGPSCV